MSTKLQLGLHLGLRAAGLLLGIWALLRLFAWRNIYYPTRVLLNDPRRASLPYEEVEFVAEDGCRLFGWWFPLEKSRGAVVVCHGNAGNIGDRLWMVPGFQALGLEVFLFDYRGYGRSRGLPTERGLYRDARAAFEVARARFGDSDDPPIIAYGRSLGGAVAVQLALDKPVRALVVESAFTSLTDMGRRFYPWLPVGLVCWRKYDVVGKIARVKVPKLIAHSRDDSLIPFEMGQRLYAAAPESKVFCELAGDHDRSTWEDSAACRRALARVVDGVLSR